MMSTPRTPGSRFLISPSFDVGWFVVPGILTAALAVALGLGGFSEREGGDLALWIVGILLVDVTHVYASIYRTYLDPVARRIHRTKLIVTPLLCLWFGLLLHHESRLLFWGALAYVAVFHFIKQHVGFVALYARAGGESARDRRLASLTLWAGLLAPVVHWHLNLPRAFDWFVQGDFWEPPGLPGALRVVTLLAPLPLWIAFAIRRVRLWRAGRGNVMVPLLVVVPALNWHLGIVAFNDDRIFTLTNVFLHGVPYLALVWVTGGRETVTRGLARVLPGTRGRVKLGGLCVLCFYGLLLALAYAEEFAWDRLVWHDRPLLFGGASSDFELVSGSLLEALIVAALTVPQATHYFLDRWIWRVGPKNPRLAAQLGLSAPRPRRAA